MHLFVNVLFLQRTLQKQSMTYGGKSTVRDRSSGTSSSVAFTPLQVHKHVGITRLEVVTSSAFKLFSHRVAQFPCCSLAETLTDSCGLVDWSVCCLSSLRGSRLWTHRLQKRRWAKPIRNISPTWPSSSKSSVRRRTRCEAVR